MGEKDWDDRGWIGTHAGAPGRWGAAVASGRQDGNDAHLLQHQSRDNLSEGTYRQPRTVVERAVQSALLRGHSAGRTVGGSHGICGREYGQEIPAGAGGR